MKPVSIIPLFMQSSSTATNTTTNETTIETRAACAVKESDYDFFLLTSWNTSQTILMELHILSPYMV